MKISYARVANLALKANKQRAQALAQGDASQVGIKTEVIDARGRNGGVTFMTLDVVNAPVRPTAVINVQGRDGDVTIMTLDVVTAPVRPVQPVQPVTNAAKKVPNSLIKIQELVFDHATELPDGLYKQLMDALVIKG